MIKKIIKPIFFCTIFIICLNIISAKAYIEDDANLISDLTKGEIKNLIADLDREYSTDIRLVIKTIESVSDEVVYDLAVEMRDKYNLDREGNLLYNTLLLYVKKKDVTWYYWFNERYNLETEIKEVLEDSSVKGELKEKNYNEAFRNAAALFVEAVKQKYEKEKGIYSKKEATWNNVKYGYKYAGKPVFLISDENLRDRDMLSAVPIAVWYDKDRKLHQYPLLVYHKIGEDDFDADSIISFLKEYKPDKVIVLTKTPKDLIELIKNEGFSIAYSEEAANWYNILKWGEKATKHWQTENWESIEDIVVAGYGIETGLIASDFAAHINAPLLFVDRDSYKYKLLLGKGGIYFTSEMEDKYVHVVGEIDEKAEKYIEEKATKKFHWSEEEIEELLDTWPKKRVLNPARELIRFREAHPDRSISDISATIAADIFDVEFEKELVTPKSFFEEGVKFEKVAVKSGKIEDYQKAIDNYKEALNKKIKTRHSVSAQVRTGHIYFELGQWGNALSAYQKGKKLFDEVKSSENDYDTDGASYEYWMEGTKADGICQYRIIQSYEKINKDKEEIKKEYEELIIKRLWRPPHYGYYLAAIADEKLGDFYKEDAEEYEQKMIGEQKWEYRELDSIYVSSEGHYKRAKKYYEKFIKDKTRDEWTKEKNRKAETAKEKLLKKLTDVKEQKAKIKEKLE